MAVLKVVQHMVGIKFLGIAFTVLRFVLTLVALVLMGLLMEKILRKFPDEERHRKADDQLEQSAPEER